MPGGKEHSNGSNEETRHQVHPLRRISGQRNTRENHSRTERRRRERRSRSIRYAYRLGPQQFPLASDLRYQLLWHRIHGCMCRPIRHRSLRFRSNPKQSPTGRCHPRKRHHHPQNGSCTPTPVRPDGRPQIRRGRGRMRRQWRPLPQVLPRGAGRGPDTARRRLCARLSSAPRSLPLRHDAAAAQGED